MLLVVDNGSVFTQNLTGFLSECGVSFEERVPESVDLGGLDRYDSVILSGRKRNDRETNRVNSQVVKYCIGNGTKLLGICYGAEILALAAGGAIRRSGLCRGSEMVQVERENGIAAGTLNVFESHSYEISRLPRTMVSLGGSESCRHEMVQYMGLPIYGVQFHPEMSEDGRRLIGRFCSL